MKINTLKKIEYSKFSEDNGQLSIFQVGVEIPYEIKRIFTVLANNGDIRGNHAHKSCSQLLICLAGKIRLTCDDGMGNIETFLLDQKSKGILISPRIWAFQEYLLNQSVLMVVCDQPYNPDEYIRNYDDFISIIKVQS
jgi:dTDP-4-dehydrorhamnose 3,5-epimerase-like enzyme